MTTSYSSREYARLATADRARIASARALLAAGREDAARAVLAGVQVLTWSAEQVAATIPVVEERKAA